MKEQHMSVDINSYIADLTCPVTVKEGKPVVALSFKSLHAGTMTAIKFAVKGYNSFGEIVPVNGEEQFLITVQDISVPQNGMIRNLQVPLPQDDIRKIELMEHQYSFADGTTAMYEGEKWVDYDVELFDTQDAEEKEQLDALKTINAQAAAKPAELDGAWVCLCGHYNTDENNVCNRCEMTKETAFETVQEPALGALMESYKEKKAHAAEADKKKKKLLMLLSIPAALVLALIITLAGNAAVLSQRKTFDSAADMQKALQGRWTAVTEDGKTASGRIVISENKLESTAGSTSAKASDSAAPSSDDSSAKETAKTTDNAAKDTKEITWKPSRGVFKADGKKYIVEKNGRIKDSSGKEYKKAVTSSKSGSSSSGSKSSSSKSGSSSSGSSILKISNTKVTSNSSYTICTGTLTNNGKSTYKFVQVKGAFQNSSGKVVDTDSTYAVGAEGLAPGESTTFRLSIKKNASATKCNVTIFSFK